MKVLMSKKEQMILTPCKRVDLKGKATIKPKFWRIEVVNKKGEKSTYCEVRNEDFGVVCEILNIKDLAKMNEDSMHHVALEKLGQRLMDALYSMKSYIKVVNKDTFYIINNNDDIILKTKIFNHIILDLEYRAKAQQASIEENIGF